MLAGVIALVATDNMPARQSTLFTCTAILVGSFLPYSYTSYRRSRGFQKFEELFPEAIDTLDASCAAQVPAIHTVGVVASQPLNESGALSPESCEKAIRLM